MTVVGTGRQYVPATINVYSYDTTSVVTIAQLYTTTVATTTVCAGHARCARARQQRGGQAGPVGAVVAPPLPAPPLQCKRSGRLRYPIFATQGDCLSYLL